VSVADGTVLGATKVIDNGPDSVHWNLVLVAEGYRDEELAQFAIDVDQFAATLFATPPFDRLRPAINVHRIDVASTDSGADDPAACPGGTGETAATYFDASFCNFGIQRLLLVNTETVLAVASAQVPAWHVVLVLVNTTVYGGAGGTVSTFSKAPSAHEIGLHEMGHTAFNLADEYEFYVGCGLETDHNHHPAVEPDEPNVTINADRDTIKWRELILPSTQMPTTANADCTVCDPQPSPVRFAPSVRQSSSGY